MALQDGGGKLPGKEEYSGRRRATTRKSGFKAHADSTGGEFRQLDVDGYELKAGQSLRLDFEIPPHSKNVLVAYGGWFRYAGDLLVTSQESSTELCLKAFRSPAWSKFGSLWKSSSRSAATIIVRFQAISVVKIAFWKVECGVILHPHLRDLLRKNDARSARLLSNMSLFSPESHFMDEKGTVKFSPRLASLKKMNKKFAITLKSCNRCARFLPINIGGDNERNHLSFSNHCVAIDLRPCRHTGFGLLKNSDTGEVLRLDYGFQLECRFCKKFEVNAAHNPQRTTAQLKEDAARRRGFELLLEALYGGSPQLIYRHETNRELADDVWNKFGRKCFKCPMPLKTANQMHLDHTRPLALLWPLDYTATALCKTCNSEKRDRPPALFYNEKELKALSKITGIPVAALHDPSPNLEALCDLGRRLDWFFNKFLTSPEMVKVRDGKVTGELLVKALDKVDSMRAKKDRMNLLHLYDARRSRK